MGEVFFPFALFLLLCKGSGSVQVVFLGPLQDKNRFWQRIQRIYTIALVKLTLMDFLQGIPEVHVYHGRQYTRPLHVCQYTQLAHKVGIVVVIIIIVATSLRETETQRRYIILQSHP